MGRTEVDAGEAAETVEAGERAAFFFSADWRIWSLDGRKWYARWHSR